MAEFETIDEYGGQNEEVNKMSRGLLTWSSR